MEPFFKKMETYHGDDQPNSIETHGFDGPLHASSGHVNRHALNSYYTAAKKVLGDSYKEVEDANDFKSIGMQQQGWKKWIDPNTGKRSGSADAYIHANSSRKNLIVRCDTTVNKLVLDGDRVVGVEAIVDGQTQTIKCSKEVIVAAGAFGSPKLLELSGIGNPDILKAAGIEPRINLPAVGENYQDHLLYLNMHHCDPNAPSHDHLYRQIEPEFSSAQKEWAESGTGPLVSNNIDPCGKHRPTDEEVKGTKFEALWNAKFKNRPEKPLALLATITGCVGDFSVIPEGRYYATGAYLEYPESRGTVHMKTNDPQVDPVLEGFYVTSEDDVEVLCWYYKKTREIARNMSEYRGEFGPSHPAFDPKGKAAIDPLHDQSATKGIDHDTVAPSLDVNRDALPAKIDLEKPHPSGHGGKLEYSDADDQVLREWIKANAGTTWHPLGTCSIGSSPQTSVVDAFLRVHKTRGLRVCDLSVCPLEPGCNLASMAYVIGERGADLIVKDVRYDEEKELTQVHVAPSA